MSRRPRGRDDFGDVGRDGTPRDGAGRLDRQRGEGTDRAAAGLRWVAAGEQQHGLGVGEHTLDESRRGMLLDRDHDPARQHDADRCGDQPRLVRADQSDPLARPHRRVVDEPLRDRHHRAPQPRVGPDIVAQADSRHERCAVGMHARRLLDEVDERRAFPPHRHGHIALPIRRIRPDT